MADLDKKLSRNSERLAAQEVPSITAADQVIPIYPLVYWISSEPWDHVNESIQDAGEDFWAQGHHASMGVDLSQFDLTKTRTHNHNQSWTHTRTNPSPAMHNKAFA